MFVSGFTIARNVVRADYPLREAVFSILPVCDEFVISVGDSDDRTLEYVKSFGDPKIKIIETKWDDNLRVGGRVLAQETNKAKDAVNSNADWLFYIQADECLHEKYLSKIRDKMQSELKNEEIDGLLFDYKHFYGSYDYEGDSRKWYRQEIRVIRNNPQITSYRDAQGFRLGNADKLTVVHSGCTMYHYGWVKHPKLQQAKQEQFHRMWHDDNYMKKNVYQSGDFDYHSIDSLAKFNGTHPAIMQARIDKQNWVFDHDISKKKFNLKSGLLYFIEKLTGWRIGEYKNYKLLH
ncbi:MAG: glycosyltransferase family 2 protein [Bacteroidetes bacterium]|nr:glycosyltransferase family 2 protein [Bacteroidota bacterium]